MNYSEMTEEQRKAPIKWKGYSYIRIRGNCDGPARFWDVTIFTEEEYDALSDVDKKTVDVIVQYWYDYLDRYWPNEPEV